MFAVSRPLDKGEVRPLGLHVASVLGIADAVDTGCLEPVRLLYLPRAPRERLGAFEHREIEGRPIDVDALLREATRARDVLQAAQHRKAPPRSGAFIEAFNAAHDVGEVLEALGYKTKGRNRWLFPGSTSRMPGVRLLPESDPPRIYSSHAGDPLNDGHAHDAFDCYRVLLHGGDLTAAVREAAKLRGMDLRGQIRPDMPETDDGEGCPIGDEFPDLSHDQLALDLSQRAGWTHSARYVSGWGKWLFWDGARWQQDDKLHHMTEVRRFLRDMAADLSRWAIKKGAEMQAEERGKLVKWAKREARVLRQAPTCAKLEATARSNPDLAAVVDQFDANLDVIGTPAGTVDLRTGEIRPADPNHYITKITNVSPAPRGTRAPRWEKFIHWAQSGDPEMLAFLKRLCGYALTGHTSEHKLPFLWGPGGNGKSVFANTLFGVMGDYVRKAPAETFLDSQGGRHPTDLAGLRGSRLVVGSELPAGKTWNESVIKDLTGGDVITARLMRQDFFDYKPQFTLVIVGNHQPSFRGVDDAIRRRVLLIPFIAKIAEAEKDRDLEEKLKAEWPAILRWAVEGAVEWYQHGLNPPRSVIEASDEYLDGEDLRTAAARCIASAVRSVRPST